MENRQTKVTQAIRSPIVRTRRETLPGTIETKKVLAVMCPAELLQLHVGHKLDQALSSHISCLVEYHKPELVDHINSILIEAYNQPVTQTHVDIIRGILEA